MAEQGLGNIRGVMVIGMQVAMDFRGKLVLGINRSFTDAGVKDVDQHRSSTSIEWNTDVKLSR